MERVSETLTIEEVIEINRRQIELFGGSFFSESNLRNRESLEFALDAIDAASFGQVLYPRLSDKASMLGFNIISSHVFFDGNKRTAMTVCRIFLLLNGFDLEIQKDVVDQEAMDICIAMADSKLDREGFASWIEERMTPLSI